MENFLVGVKLSRDKVVFSFVKKCRKDFVLKTIAARIIGVGVEFGTFFRFQVKV